MFIEQSTYNEIKRTFPINAVELLIFDSNNNLLMVKRINEPAKGKWWIPGGRVLFAESRMDAAKRLLKDECGVNNGKFSEPRMFDYLVKNNTEDYYQHIISTVFSVTIDSTEIKLDSQSSEYRWQPLPQWIKEVEHSFLLAVLVDFQKGSTTGFSKEQSVRSASQAFIKNDLYDVILKSLAIPCVDLLVHNKVGEILLVKRKNAPSKDEWWVPGGRVIFAENRLETAQRKLHEECNLKGMNYKEIDNFDFVYHLEDGRTIHNISTLFGVDAVEGNVKVDEQSSDYSWRTKKEWLKETLHPFMKDVLEGNIGNGRSKKVYN